MDTVDTIAAICTGIGGAISIIRISGAKSLDVVRQVWQGKVDLGTAPTRQLTYGHLNTGDDSSRDVALAAYMPGPNSYTGEDVVELHCHGGVLTAKNVLAVITRNGARLAEPGEFTFRAFVNGKLDLTQAEAVADIITAHTDMALHLAERQLAGRLHQIVVELRTELIELLADCESRLDFAEESLGWDPPDVLNNRIERIQSQLTDLLSSRQDGTILREGIRVVIAGRPNVGKSSLLNLLLGFDRAIVTQIPGTTRDTLEEFAHIRGIPVKLTDTAGIREADDLIEGMGIERSKATMEQAQIILWLLDASSTDLTAEVEELKKHAIGRRNVVAVWNKTDLLTSDQLPEMDHATARISVVDRTGISEFLDLFEETVWGFPHTEDPEVAVNNRHADLLESTVKSLPQAMTELTAENWELAAIHLRDAISSLGSIIGEEIDPDILDNIFSRFCIGK